VSPEEEIEDLSLDFEMPENEPAPIRTEPVRYKAPPERTTGVPAALPDEIAFEATADEEKPDPQKAVLAGIDYSRAARADELPVGPILNFDLGDETAPAVRQVDARTVNRGLAEPRSDTLFSLIVALVVIAAIVAVAYFFGGAILAIFGSIAHNPTDAWNQFVHWIERFFQP
jgi:hypothetical protein